MIKVANTLAFHGTSVSINRPTNGAILIRENLDEGESSYTQIWCLLPVATPSIPIKPKSPGCEVNLSVYIFTFVCPTDLSVSCPVAVNGSSRIMGKTCTHTLNNGMAALPLRHKRRRMISKYGPITHAKKLANNRVSSGERCCFQGHAPSPRNSKT